MPQKGPSLSFERQAARLDGVTYVAGLDEAGRGALAGPVVAAAVILPLKSRSRLKRLKPVNDSKQLTANQREELYHLILAHALSFGIGQCDNRFIDQQGIISATKGAMAKALNLLEPDPDYLLIDGRIRLGQVNTRQQSIVRGDGKSLSIAAASILAKVTRDRLMTELDSRYPAYGFARHKGYGTAAHLAAIASHGPCPLHRHTFAPMRQQLL